MPDLRQPEREETSCRALFPIGDGAKEHAGSRRHRVLRIVSKPGCRVQRPGELLRENAFLGFLFQARQQSDGKRRALADLALINTLARHPLWVVLLFSIRRREFRLLQHKLRRVFRKIGRVAIPRQQSPHLPPQIRPDRLAL